MTDILHRVTLEIVPDVDPDNYSAAVWLVDPDLAPVQGVPSKYWKLEGDILSEMSQAEKDAVDLAALSTNRVAKMNAVDAKTRALILQGYQHNSRIFSASETAQKNMSEVRANKDVLTYPFNMATKDNSEIYAIADAAEVEAMYQSGLGTITYHYQTGNALKAACLAATTQAELDAVVDTR